jgi:hypothetical protein
MEETFQIESQEDENVFVEVAILHDDESYRVWEDFDHAEIVTAEDRNEFWEKVYAEDLTPNDVDDLAEGLLVYQNGKVYMGLERYRHSGDVYALCGRGHFPDRQWDVSPIVGWISPHPDVDADVIKPLVDSLESGEKVDATDFMKRLIADIRGYNDAINGNCWGYRVVLHDENIGNAADDDEGQGFESCWGFLGDSDYCKEEAVAIAKNMLKDYKPDYKVCECCGQKMRK